jgi:hypothetical protein
MPRQLCTVGRAVELLDAEELDAEELDAEAPDAEELVPEAAPPADAALAELAPTAPMAPAVTSTAAAPAEARIRRWVLDGWRASRPDAEEDITIPSALDMARARGGAWTLPGYPAAPKHHAPR